MNRRVCILMGAYDLFLAAGAFITGVLMVASKSGIFAEYPAEWLTKLPFHGWVVPGFAAIILFGIGNLVSGLLSIKKSFTLSWFPSAVAGSLLIIFVIAQIIILDEWYLASVEIFAAGIIQLFLSGYALLTAKSA